MTENSNRTENAGRKYMLIFAFIYTIITCADIFSYITGIYNNSVSAASAAGIAVPIAIMLVYYLFLLSVGKGTEKGALLILVPVSFCCICGYIFKFTPSVTDALFGVLSPTLAAAAVYFISKRTSSVAYCCAGASFLQFLLSVLKTAITVAFTATTENISFGTVIFDSINTFINEFITLYTQALASATAIYPGVDVQTLAAGTKQLEGVLISTIALSPALICAMLFFETYVFTKIAGLAVKLFGFEDAGFGRFTVSEVTNILFHVFAVIFMFSILFESTVSAFTTGILSVIIVLLPNYIILGIRRIFTKLSRLLSKGVCVLILLFIAFAGLMISPYLLILIVVFFGTSEYRSAKNISPLS